MYSYICQDCNRFINGVDTVYSYDLKNVCGRCYAIHYNHPSTRKLVK